MAVFPTYVAFGVSRQPDLSCSALYDEGAGDIGVYRFDLDVSQAIFNGGPVLVGPIGPV